MNLSPTQQPASAGHCNDCKAPLTNTGGYGFPRYRCIARGCVKTVFKPIDQSATTWTARGFI